MIDQAIAKINAEMQKEPSDRYLEIIGHYLIDRCDEALAAKIEGGKTLKGAMEAVVKNAKQVQDAVENLDFISLFLLQEIPGLAMLFPGLA